MLQKKEKTAKALISKNSRSAWKDFIEIVQNSLAQIHNIIIFPKNTLTVVLSQCTFSGYE